MNNIYDGYGVISDSKFIVNKKINESILILQDKDEEGNIAFLKGMFIPFNFNEYKKRMIYNEK